MIQGRATGLDQKILANGDTVITHTHVDSAPEDKKPFLSARIGQKVCSVVLEAVLQMLSSEQQRRGFAPSAPFVACFSACMVVTELIRYLTEGRTAPEARYQLSLLWGPQRGTDYPEGRWPTCFCVERAAIINKIRAGRQSSPLMTRLGAP